MAATTEKIDAVSREIFAEKSSETHDIAADSGTILTMGRVTVEIDIDINITIENSGNGSGNINSSDNGSGTESLHNDFGNRMAIA